MVSRSPSVIPRLVGKHCHDHSFFDYAKIDLPAGETNAEEDVWVCGATASLGSFRSCPKTEDSQDSRIKAPRKCFGEDIVEAEQIQTYSVPTITRQTCQQANQVLECQGNQGSNIPNLRSPRCRFAIVVAISQSSSKSCNV